MSGMILKDKDVFHVHTARCGHAELVPDESYVKEALYLGANAIWFTDHAPFPGDPFRGRMLYSELEEYIDTLTLLKKKYNGFVHVGLEIEYFPSYDESGYYKKLSNDNRIECLLLGQHMAEVNVNEYTFSWGEERLQAEEYEALGNAIVDGMKSGYFNAVAHPDRIFRRCKKWSDKMANISKKIIEYAIRMEIPLERNICSMESINNFWKEFWSYARDAQCIIGLDAHSIEELCNRYLKKDLILNCFMNKQNEAEDTFHAYRVG